MSHDPRGVPPQTAHTAAGAVNLAANLVMFLGLPFVAATAQPATVGRRLVVGPAMLLGVLGHAVLIATSVPPGGQLVIAAVVFMAVVRHRVWPSPGHTFDVGRNIVPPRGDPGRVLVSLAALALAFFLWEEPRWRGPARSLAAGAVGQVALLTFLNHRDAARAADRRDAVIAAGDVAGRGG